MDSSFQNSKAHARTTDEGREASLARYLDENNPDRAARASLSRLMSEINTKNKTRKNQIEKLRYLIYELKSIQPAELIEISETIGQSESTTRSQLKELINTDLVIRTSFENHTLYCINGHYNKLIDDWTNECFK